MREKPLYPSHIACARLNAPIPQHTLNSSHTKSNNRPAQWLVSSYARKTLHTHPNAYVVTRSELVRNAQRSDIATTETN